MKQTLSLFILLINCLILSGQYYVARYHDLQTDFSDNNNCSLFTTDDPFLYITADKRLIRYDGRNQWALWGDSVTNSEATALHSFADSLWIGYDNGQIRKSKGQDNSWWNRFEKKPRARIKHLEKNNKGQLWTATYGSGVYFHDGKIQYHFTEDDGLISGDIYDGAVLADQSFLVTTDPGIFRCSVVNGKKRVLPVTSKDQPTPILVEIWYEARQNLLIGKSYDQKVYVIDLTLGKIRQIPFPFPVKQGLTYYNGLVFAIDEKGSFPVWTYDTKSDNLQKFLLKGIENDISVIDAAMHKEGTMWILCKNNGLLSIQTSVYLYDVPLKNIQAVEYHAKGVYLGDERGLYEMDLNGNLVQKVADENILSLYLDEEKQVLWAGTYGNGILQLQLTSGKLKRIRSRDGLLDDNVFSIQRSGSSYWIATLAGVQEVSEDGRPGRVLQAKDGLPTDYIYTIFLDENQAMWLGTEGKGLVSVQDNKISRYADKTTVISVAGDSRGVIWFATLRHGLGRWDGKRLTWYTRKEGLTSEKLTGVFCDPEGNVYVTHSSGVDWIKPSGDHIVYLGNIPGLNVWKMNNNAFDFEKGFPLVTGIAGHVILYNPRHYTDVTPELVENAIQCGLTVLPEGEMVTLPHDQHNLSVDFSGIYFADPDHVQFRYKLEPQENEWRYTKNMKLVYTELKPGTYTFTVEVGLHNYYFTNQQKKYRFTILPPFYQTGWFYSLVFCLSGLFLWGVVSYRNKQKKRWMEMETEKVRIQLETLKSQINPHFLFNSFNTLIGTIEEDKNLAIQFAEKMSDFYRNILEYRDKNLITLEEEWRLHEDYVFLLKQRYGENLQFVTSVDHRNTYYIIPLTMQLLTENAIKHNIVSSVKPLVVHITQDGDQLIVSNTIQVRKTVDKSTHFGLQSLTKRYKSLFNKEIQITNKDNIFSVIIPLSKHDPDINRGR